MVIFKHKYKDSLPAEQPVAESYNEQSTNSEQMMDSLLTPEMEQEALGFNKWSTPVREFSQSNGDLEPYSDNEQSPLSWTDFRRNNQSRYEPASTSDIEYSGNCLCTPGNCLCRN
jgi:hypothetical protein